MDLASRVRSDRRVVVAFALFANASCIYVTGVSDYDKGSCEGSCTDAAVDTATPCPPDMILVGGGDYTPLSKPGGGLVRIGALCVDRTEVTESAYRACVAAGTCTPGDSRALCNYAIPGRENDPINCVNVTQARAYCTSMGKRLPTDDEWEWVARGGTLGLTYPWGNQPPAATDSPERLCWQANTMRFDATKWPARPAGTCPVGSFATGATQSGVLDLAGNVHEWTSTEAEGNTFVFRGGSAFDEATVDLYKVGFSSKGASQQYPGVGMRCFKDAP